jgi:Tat protein translocase TatB subunit
MFGSLGGPELFLILVVALIVFGPRKLPEIGKSLGRMMAEFRKASNDFRRTIEEEVEADKIREATRIEAPYAPTPAAETAPTPAAETAPAPTAETAPAAPAPVEAAPVEAASAAAPPGVEAPRVEAVAPPPPEPALTVSREAMASPEPVERK